MKTAAELYPKKVGSDFPGFYDYTPIVESFGTVVVREDQDDYQGDSWVLYHDAAADRFGYLCFGWGSCSGCDALQGCSSLAEVDELIASLHGQVQWKSRDEMRRFLADHDWGGDWHAGRAEVQRFRERATQVVGGEA